MRILTYIMAIMLLLGSCSTTRYVEVPVDKVRIEYRDKVSIDTFIKNDSVVIKEKGDSILIEKIRYVYRIKELKDTIAVTDTITKVNTVTVEKKVNELKQWQLILMIAGGAGILLTGFRIYNKLKG